MLAFPSDGKQNMVRSIVVGMIAACVGGAATAEVDLSKLRAQIERAVESEDLSAITTVFGPEVRIMPEYQKTMTGPDHAALYYETLFDGIDINLFDKTLTETIPIDMLKVDIGAFTLNYTAAQSAEAKEVSGHYFDVWEESAAGDYVLIAQAWNFDSVYTEIRETTMFDTLPGIHLAFTPSVPVDSGAAFDHLAVNLYNDAAMIRQQSDILYHVYSEDAVMYPHDSGPRVGQETIKEFLEDYTSGWPSFDYIKTASHRIEGTAPYAMSLISYNLRWDSLDNSGVSIGKGIRIMKRNEDGSLRTYRVISMHDQ